MMRNFLVIALTLSCGGVEELGVDQDALEALNPSAAMSAFKVLDGSAKSMAIRVTGTAATNLIKGLKQTEGRARVEIDNTLVAYAYTNKNLSCTESITAANVGACVYVLGADGRAKLVDPAAGGLTTGQLIEAITYWNVAAKLALYRDNLVNDAIASQDFGGPTVTRVAIANNLIGYADGVFTDPTVVSSHHVPQIDSAVFETYAMLNKQNEAYRAANDPRFVQPLVNTTFGNTYVTISFPHAFVRATLVNLIDRSPALIRVEYTTEIAANGRAL